MCQKMHCMVFSSGVYGLMMVVSCIVTELSSQSRRVCLCFLTESEADTDAVSSRENLWEVYPVLFNTWKGFKKIEHYASF